jgi:hypothetical protein
MWTNNDSKRQKKKKKKKKGQGEGERGEKKKTEKHLLEHEYERNRYWTMASMTYQR